MKKNIKSNKIKLELLFAFIFIIIILNVFSGKTYAVTNKINVKNPTEFTKALNIAKKSATKSNEYEILLNSGNYSIESGIAIPSYTKILTKKGTTINIKGQITMNANSSLNFDNSILNYAGKSSPYAIYIKPNANNVTISNGTIKGGGIYVKQSKNADISNISIKEYSESGIYALESSLKGLQSINCQGGQKGISLKQSSTEKIQLCNISGFSSTGIELYTGCSVKGDISNNSIFNSKGTAIILTGPTNKTNGSVARDIINNNIKNCKGDGIGIYHGSHCRNISNNTLDTIGGNHDGNEGDYGIIIDSMMKANTYCSKISDNIIKNVTYAGIAVYSGPANSLSNIYQDTAYVEKNIENNTLINCGTYKPSKDWKKEIANGGKKGCLSGIYVDTHARVKGDICNNNVKGTGEHGIYIHLCSYVNNINNNNIEDTVEAGIEIYHSTVVGNIYKNTVKNTGTDGIACSDKSKVNKKIYNNKILSSKGCGMYVKDSKVNSIENNAINNIQKEGIYIREKSKVKNVNSNKIKMNNQKSGCGIKIVTNSNANNMKKNTISGKMVYGIRIVGQSGDSLIDANKITSSNASNKVFTSIYLDGNTSKTVNIKKNIVSGNKTNYGIRVVKGKANIIDNNVSKATYPIYIESNKYIVKVQNNTIKGNKKNVIKITKKYFNPKSIKLSSIKNIKGNKMELKWKKSKDITAFEIYQSSSKKGNYKKVKDLKNNKYTSSKLSKGKTYYYKVSGYKKYGKVKVYTDYSKIKQVKISK